MGAMYTFTHPCLPQVKKQQMNVVRDSIASRALNSYNSPSEFALRTRAISPEGGLADSDSQYTCRSETGPVAHAGKVA